MSDNRQKCNNKGFSLLEMIVVLAVITVVTALTTLTVVVVHNARVSEGAANMKSAITTSRVQSMAKGTEGGKLVISVDNGSVYAQIGEGEKKRICNKMIECYRTNSATMPTQVEGDNVSGGSGDIATITFNSAGMVVDADYNCFIFTRKSKSVAVMVYPETGKVVSKLL